MAKMYQDILVPLDGSDGANRAGRHALDIAEQYGANVHTLFVVDTRRYGEPGLSSTEIVVDEIEAEGAEILDDFAERADNKAIEVTTKVVHGIPHQTITEYADELDADVIVLGYQGHSHEMEGHIGSVAERVVRYAGRPVLVV